MTEMELQVSKLTDMQVEQEIERLRNSDEVKLAKKEYTLRNKRRQYLYTLKTLYKHGAELMDSGITLDNVEGVIFGDVEEEYE